MLGLILAFIVINVMLYFGHKLYHAVLVGIIPLVILSRMALADIYDTLIHSVTDSMFILLALIVILMTAFGNLLKETGSLKIMVEKLSLVIKDLRLQLILLPALVGLLAFPGGAVFSAPMVEEAGARLELDRTRLAVINIMFRHIVFLVFPFYTALILLGQMSGISVLFFIRINLPVTVFFFIVLILVLFKGVKQPSMPRAKLRELPALFQSLFPILATVVLAVVFDIYFPVAILAGIVFALMNFLPKDVALFQAIKPRLLFLWRGINWSMALSVVSVIVLKYFLERSGAVASASELFVSRGVPLLVLALLIPYFTSFFAGSPSTAIHLNL